MREPIILNWARQLHWEEYLRPSTLSEALDLLERFHGDARVLAGGTDLLVQIRQRQTAPRAIVDITRITGLDRIEMENGTVRIGGLVTHAQTESSTLLRASASALSEGASHVGSPQIRNLGTLAGNIVNGQPGADTAIPLLALGASVQVANRRGTRRIPLPELFLDVGKTSVDSRSEIVTEISFPALKNGETSAYLRIANRRALALPILAVCVVLSADIKNRKIRYGRITVGPVARTPFNAIEAAALLNDARMDERLIRETAKKAARTSDPRDSLLRGCSEYRRAMVENLVERAMWQCIRRLEESHA